MDRQTDGELHPVLTLAKDVKHLEHLIDQLTFQGAIALSQFNGATDTHLAYVSLLWDCRFCTENSAFLNVLAVERLPVELR